MSTKTAQFINNATEQEIFDKVALHLLTQGKKSEKYLYSESEKRGDIRCVYRGPNKTMCAAGCLIADEDYDPKFETKTWGMISPLLGAINSKMLICKLQMIHDISEVNEWPNELLSVASRYFLSPSVVLNFKKAKNNH